MKSSMVMGAFLLLGMSPGLLVAGEQGHVAHAWVPEVWHVGPFIALLLCIAVLGLIPQTAHWWEHNKSKGLVVLAFSLPVLLLVLLYDLHLLPHAGLEYFQFLTLIASLFVVAGGLHITGNLQAKPSTNTAILTTGFLMASVVGTTGAAMIFIYPLLRANQEREHKRHTVVFFIFLVANCGGLLTPLGDPPLFIGYLRGVPFLWFAEHLWKVWLLTGGILIALYYLLDTFRYYPRETRKHLSEDIAHAESLGLIGLPNLLFLTIIGGAVGLGVPTPWREVILWGAAIASLMYSRMTDTGYKARQRNKFTFVPIMEVAILFAGIFVTMIPALRLLEVKGPQLGVDTIQEYFWATGIFSSFLDNAPTYLVFKTLGMATEGMDVNNPTDVLRFSQSFVHILAAIAIGAVFMGANTYIGNAPNFMVKSVAENQGVKMPSFLGYMGWSCAILVPIFIVIGLLIPSLV